MINSRAQSTYVLAPWRNSCDTMNALNDFDDENPFEQESHGEESSTPSVAIYEPSSPHRPSQILSPLTQNTNRSPFPSTGSHKSQSVNYKTDFCCSSDRYLHSGDSFEILVCHQPLCVVQIRYHDVLLLRL